MTLAGQPSNASHITPRASRAMWGWMLFIAWTILACASILQIAVAFSQRGQPVPWRSIVPDRFIDWYTCALFTPVCFWLARKYPLTARSWRTTLPAYVLVTSICVVLKCALMVGILAVIGSTNNPTFGRAFAQNFLFDSIVLWCVIAVIHALELQVNLSQREHAALELRAQLSEAELQLLKGQLQPHFLFNTLNGVASLIHTAPKLADFVVVQLADLLRASIDHDSSRAISLADELSLLDKYLGIMDARFQGRVTVHRDIDEGAYQAMVPQFLLQPLVENAFEHGIGRRSGPGNIHIRVARIGNTKLRFEIVDDGVGLPGSGEPVLGIGLSNTRKRLERLYGDAQLLQLFSLPEGGAQVSIEIPFALHDTGVLIA